MSPAEQANAIASWCEEQHGAEEGMARQQIRWVFISVAVGILLLLAMPRLIQEIDYLWRTDSLPTAIIQKARTTQGDIEVNRQEMADEVNAATSRQREITDELIGKKRILEEIEGQLNADLAKRFGMFRHALGADRNDRWALTKVIQTSDGRFMAAGYESNENEDDGETILLLHSTDSGSWTAMRPDINGQNLRGRLHGLLQAADGTFVAAGFQISKDDGETLLLLRSNDGTSWTPVHLALDGKKLRGRLHRLLQAANGTFVAVGFQQATNDEETILILRSTDGTSWGPAPPFENEKKLQGRLHSLLQAADGTFFAVGFEGAGTNTVTLLLRSSDGLSWKPIYPTAHGHRILGRLYSIVQAQDMSFLAVGLEGTTRLRHKALLAHSSDGVSWHPVPLATNGRQLRGSLHHIAQATDGSFVAVGGEMGRFSPMAEIGTSATPAALAESIKLSDRFLSFRGQEMPRALWPFFGIPTLSTTFLLLRSEDGASWTVSPLYKDGVRLFGSLRNLLLTDNNSILTGSPYFWLESIPNEEAKNLREEIVKSLEISADLVVGANIWPLLREASEHRKNAAVLDKNLRQQDEFVETAQNSLARQHEARTSMEKIVTELDQALRQVELVREAGQIATRIAIVGLLIYLVQILVNRYRYHRHVAKFYKARAQALRLFIADSSTGVRPFSNASLADLAAALSPDGTYFDKAPRPPAAVFTFKQ